MSRTLEDLQRGTRAQLIELAREEGIDVNQNWPKDRLIEALAARPPSERPSEEGGTPNPALPPSSALSDEDLDGYRAAIRRYVVTATEVDQATLAELAIEHPAVYAHLWATEVDRATLAELAIEHPAVYAHLWEEEYRAEVERNPHPRAIASTIPSVHVALLDVMAKVGPIAKNQRNIDSHYASRSIDDVFDTLHDLMADAGVIAVPTVKSAEYREHGKQTHAFLEVCWTFYGPAGDCVEAVLRGEALDSSDKATNKALQASLKYLLLDTFLIPLNGPDADATSPEMGELTEEQERDLWAREHGWGGGEEGRQSAMLLLKQRFSTLGPEPRERWNETAAKRRLSYDEYRELRALADASTSPAEDASKEERLATARGIIEGVRGRQVGHEGPGDAEPTGDPTWESDEI
jgi:hypothetical protein